MKTTKSAVAAANEVVAHAQVVSAANANAPLVNLADYIAAQGAIDTTKNAPVEAAAKTKAQSAAKPTAKKAQEYKDIEFNVRGGNAAKLFAHTAAWLELSGLIHGKAAPADLIKDLGGSALSYHTKQGNMAQSQGLVTLTGKGMDKFKARQEGGHGAYAQEDMEHYMLMMMAGEKDDRLVKSAGAIKRLAAN